MFIFPLLYWGVGWETHPYFQIVDVNSITVTISHSKVLYFFFLEGVEWCINVRAIIKSPILGKKHEFVLLSCFLCIYRTGSFHFRKLVITPIACDFRDKWPKLIYLLKNPSNFSNLSDVNNASAIFTSVLFFQGYMMNSHEFRGRKKHKPMFLQYLYIRRTTILWLVPTLNISIGWQEAS